MKQHFHYLIIKIVTLPTEYFFTKIVNTRGKYNWKIGRGKEPEGINSKRCKYFSNVYNKCMMILEVTI